MEVVRLAGRPRAMGHAFGARERDAIHALYRARLDNAIEQAAQYGGQHVTEDDVREIARRCLAAVATFSPRGRAELEGIAEGAGLSLDQVWAMNALTDLRDVAAYHDARTWAQPVDAEGCSSFVAMGDRTNDGQVLMAQTWDLSTSNMPFVRVVVRHPDVGPKTVCLTTVGCLSLIGLNACGIAIGTTNLRTTDASVGVGYLDIIHEALAQRTFADAVRTVESAPRAGAHYYTVADSTRAALIECAAGRHETVRPSGGVHVHTNHFVDEGLKQIEAQGTPQGSSHRRKSDLEALLDSPGRRSVADAQAALANHDSGVLSVCRHDYSGISTNGAVVMKPEAGRFWAVHGPPCRGEWIEVAFDAAVSDAPSTM